MILAAWKQYQQLENQGMLRYSVGVRRFLLVEAYWRPERAWPIDEEKRSRLSQSRTGMAF